MSESTEELKSAVQGVTETLGEVGNLAGHLSEQATELAEEAAGHGWHGIATRMQETAEALEATAGQVDTGRKACDNASTELGLINEKIPAEDVVTHLTTSNAQLSDAVTAVEEAIEKSEEAQAAADEIGQQGMMQATSDLHDRLTKIHEQIVQHQLTSGNERIEAETFAAKQLGK